MGRTPGAWWKPGNLEAMRPPAARLTLYALVALPFLAATTLLGLDRTFYAIVLLILLGLTIRYLELHQRKQKSARELSALNQELQRALAAAETLVQVSKELSSQVRLEAIVDLMVRHARVLLEADTAAVATPKEQGGGALWVSLAGFRSEALKGMAAPLGRGLAGRAMATGRPLVVEDLAENPPFPLEEVPLHLAEGIVSALAVPLVLGGFTTGALVAGYRRRRAFSDRDVGLATAMASQAAVALENARLYRAQRGKADELAAVIDHMSDGVVVTDAGGRVVQRNRAAVGLLGDVAVGEPLAAPGDTAALRMESPDGESLPPEGWPTALVGRGERFTGREVVVRRADDTIRHLNVDGRPVLNDRGEVVLGVTVMHDVTAAREMDQLRDEFLALAAHELKTPLTSLKGYAQILLGAAGGELKPRERLALEVMGRQVDRINRMVEQFLRVAEIRSGRFPLRPERVDLSALATAATEEIRRIANSHEIVCLSSGPLEVVADPKSLDLVLSNLLHNALKYSPEGSRVELALAAQGREAVVAVRDQGVGIPREKQSHLFERFYQVQPGTGSQGGIGLGLYISQQLIEAQGGRMWLDSKAGEGSSFYFALPLAVDP